MAIKRTVYENCQTCGARNATLMPDGSVKQNHSCPEVPGPPDPPYHFRPNEVIFVPAEKENDASEKPEMEEVTSLVTQTTIHDLVMVIPNDGTVAILCQKGQLITSKRKKGAVDPSFLTKSHAEEVYVSIPYVGQKKMEIVDHRPSNEWVPVEDEDDEGE